MSRSDQQASTAAAARHCRRRRRWPAVGGARPASGGPPSRPAPRRPPARREVAPGELDEYYVFFSGGQSGEIRIVGLPSMRELMRIPVFNRESATGWGQTNESRRVLTEGLTPETREFLADKGGVYMNGDLHHPHPSFTDGTYDGRYLFCNDKANTRVARIRLDVMRVDKIIQMPNQHTVHGLRLQKFPRTGYVYCQRRGRRAAAERRRDPRRTRAVPLDLHRGRRRHHEGRLADQGRRQPRQRRCRLPGQVLLLDLLQLRERRHPGRDDGQRAGLGRHLQPQAHRGGGEAGEVESIGGVPVLDGSHGSPFTRYVPVANSPHGINTAPDGIHVVAAGKLSPTVTVFDVRQFDDLFDDKIEPRDTVVAEPELGLGPLHTAYDGKGNAYTTLFIDSQVCKWNIEDAKRAFQGEQVDPIRQKLDVHYQPGHNHTSMGQTKEADGKWLISLNKFSKDRFLNVGPLKPENDQLIDISGDQMVLVHDNPTFAEPHDATIVHASKINPVSIWDRADPFFAEAVKMAEADGIDLEVAADVIRDGDKVRVYMSSAAPAFSLDSFTVKQGDEVTVFVTNIDEVEDLTHGFSIINYGINMEMAPQATASVTFKADKPGVLLVLLLLVLPCDAHGDEGPHAGGARRRMSPLVLLCSPSLCPACAAAEAARRSRPATTSPRRWLRRSRGTSSPCGRRPRGPVTLDRASRCAASPAPSLTGGARAASSPSPRAAQRSAA